MSSDINLVNPTDDITLQQIDRWRTLLSTDPLTKDVFALPIRDYPVTTVPEGKPVVSIHSPDEDYDEDALGPSGIGQYAQTTRLMLIISVNESATVKTADLIAMYRTLHNAKGAFKRAIVRYRADPTPGTDPSGVGRLWHKLKWIHATGSSAGGDHTAMFYREVGVSMRVVLQFEIFSKQKNT